MPKNQDPLTPKDLEQMREELASRLAQVDALLEKSLPVDDQPVEHLERNGKQPVRVKVLDALEDFDWPMYTRQIAHYVGARTGDRIQPARFGVLARDEQNSFNSKRVRPVYLGFALTAPRGEAIKRLLVRSDWELERRIVAPTTGRVQHLQSTARFCELAMELADRAAHPERLRFLAADHARDLPGVKVRHGRFDLEKWLEVARAELVRILPRDQEERAAAAARLQHLPERALLFGIPDVIDGDGAVLRVVEGKG